LNTSGNKKQRQQMRKTLWQEASKDELLMNDIAEIESTFEHVDSEIYS
jgi:hypothetical protein